MTERNSLRQVPVFHVHGLNVIKRSAGIILSAGRFSPSYGWLYNAAKMNWYLQRSAWKDIVAPILLFQAETDSLVSLKAQDIFAEKINNCGKTSCTLIRMAGTKHEIF